VSTGTVHYWIASGFLPARRGPARRWCIPFPPEVATACAQRAAGSPHQHTDIDNRPRRADEHSIAEVATRLGVKHDIVYRWAERRYLPTRRGPGGRVWIRLTPDIETACLQRIANSHKLPAHIKAQAQQRMEGIAV
jgi:hypothetical protein